MNTTATNRHYSAAVPAVSFESVTGGVRVRREGKGDTLLVTRDDRARGYDTHLIVMHDRGVVGRVAYVDGDWFWEYGIFRNWDYSKGIWQVFPSSTVKTFGGFASFEDAVVEAALYLLS
jgi:hypothetical protein